ncbi:hypothetical protein Tco_0422775 [Tanacetum coccineum]
MGDENPISTLGDYSKPSHEGYRNTIKLLDGNNVVPLRSDTIRLVQNGCSFHRLRSEDPNQHLKDFLKLVDSFDLDVPSTSDRRLVELENQVQRLIEAHLASKQHVQVARLSKFEADFKQQQSELTNKIDTVLKAITDRITGALPSDTVKNPKQNVDPTSPVLSAQKVRKLNSFLESSGLVPQSSDTNFFCTKEDDGDVMFIEIIKKYDDSHEEELEVEVNAITEGLGVEYFDTFPSRSELAYHIYPMSGPIPSLFLRDPSIVE